VALPRDPATPLEVIQPPALAPEICFHECFHKEMD
jgi:hypothetical protein